MVVYHVTTVKKLNKYIQNGAIKSPVRVWICAEAAERFSKQTGRRIILRLKTDDSFVPYEGHRQQALISNKDYILENF